MHNDTSTVLQIIKKTVRKAGISILRDFSEVENLQVLRKGPADFVSKADKNSEEIIKKDLLFARPDFTIICEESGVISNEDIDNIFIIDPLDGTTNFLHGLPHWAINVAYRHKGETLVAVTYDPLKDEMFFAEKGKGAYMNNTRLRVSGRYMISDALIATGTPFLGVNIDKQSEYLEYLGRIMSKISGVRRFGSAALDLAYVAAGRYDGYFEYGLNPWDIEAGILLIREAGGFIVNEKNMTYKIIGCNKQEQWIIATNNSLYNDIINILNGK